VEIVSGLAVVLGAFLMEASQHPSADTVGVGKQLVGLRSHWLARVSWIFTSATVPNVTAV